jgi:hypothetical protein
MTAAAALSALMMLADLDPASQRCITANHQIGQPLKLCIERQALQFEKSGESPDNIATAVLSACRTPRQTYLDAIVACRGVVNEDAVGDSMDQVFRNRVIEIVVQFRSERHSAK